MPIVSNRFKFEYFPRGGGYSAKSEYQRFVTVDYNTQSYVGVIGVGIIEGWEIQQTTGTEIQILPGRGIINGYFAESPYVIKKRSEMISGDREVEVVKLQQSFQPDMTDAEADAYIVIIQEYNSSFNPSKPIENAYVKVVVPEVISISDHADIYIWVTREFSNYYPPLADFPAYLIPEPSILDYETFDDYLVAKSAHDIQMDGFSSYQFRDDTANHFTEVMFNTGVVFSSTPTKVLLGKVTTRGGSVISINTSEVNTLKNLESTIKSYANKIVASHRHGGEKEFDPSRINLETDIRQAILTSYNPESRRGNFSVLESQLTNVEKGHRHTFSINSNSNGQTVGIIGSSNNHYHKIVDGIVQTPEFTTAIINNHIHTLPSISNFSWTDESDYVVYINGVQVGDSSSTNIISYPERKTISLVGIIGGITKTYGVDFEYNGRRFQFSEQQSGVFRFMLKVMQTFYESFSDIDISTHPFLFFDNDTHTLAGLTDLRNQSITAEALLKSSGDKFTFTSNAARNIEVTLIDYQKTVGLEADSVTVEILGNSEVKNVLRPENIFFINAQKITSGIFEISQIPFLSHIGRPNESLSPFSYPLISSDRIEFLVTPSVTTSTSDHYHNLIVNEGTSGFTENTFIDHEPVYYAIDQDNETHLVAHLHSVLNGTVQDKESKGLLNWQNNINNTKKTNSTHTHDIIYPINGDVKVVYSMFEDRFGNLYVGTSDDLLMIPVDDSFVFVINNQKFYETGTDLLTMFQNAKRNYEIKTGTPLKISSDIYTVQISLAEEALINTGDSYLIIGKSETNSDADTTMIQKLSYIPIPNYKSTELKDFDEVGSNEVLVEVRLRDKKTGALLDSDSDTVKDKIEEDPNSVKIVAKVERYFDSIPAISIEVQEIVKNGVTNDKILIINGNSVATNVNLQNSFYFDWESPNTPPNVGVLKNAKQDEEGSIWVASNNGVLVLRSHNQSTIFSRTTIPGSSPDIQDILVFTSDNVYCASDGIYKTENQGKTWDKKLSGNFNQIIQDYASIKVVSNFGHTHVLNVNINGNGTLEETSGHTHSVTNWTVIKASGHTHVLNLILFAVSSKNVYRSSDSGESWSLLMELPQEENGNLFVFNGSYYLSKADGIYNYSGSWVKISDIIAYSYQISYDLSYFYIGSVNKIYEFSGSSFTEKFSFSGSPLPTLSVNGRNRNFGYAYSNRRQKFYLNRISFTDKKILFDQKIFSFVNFDRWFAENGSWGEDMAYDIFINNKLILSTKTNVDNREAKGWSFTVDPLVGLIDFSGETELSSKLSVFDNFIEVNDSSDFQVGDRIVIQKTRKISKVSSSVDSTSTDIGKKESISEAVQREFDTAKAISIAEVAQRELDITYFYATITSIYNNVISFSPRSTIHIGTPAKVSKIPNLNANSSIILNIYDSVLSNVGINVHKDLENKLSYESDQRPYQFNNSYLSNLLQLTQSVKYVYPDINSKMVQSLFYDFHYSENPSDDNYVGNFIDILNSESYSLVNFQSPFEAKKAISINKILIGTGTFSGNVIVGTDIGVFWAIQNENLNTNWFYVWGIKRPVYDISIFGGNNLLVATNNGVYLTKDMITWTLQNQEAVRFPSFSMCLRWPEESFIIIQPHTVNLQNSGSGSIQGSITTTGRIYSELVPNRSIKIETLDNPSNPNNKTSYVIIKVYPNSLVVSPSFINVPDTLTNVRITVGSWWQQFSGENNLGNSSITNTLLVGGRNKIAYTTYLDSFVWVSGLFDSEIKGVNIVSFLPLSSGSILSNAVGTNLDDVSHYILRSFDLGKVWSSYQSFKEIRGTIQSSKLSTFGHTIISVVYTFPKDFRYADGELDKRKISIFNNLSSTSIFDGKVIFNGGFNSTIVIFGQDAYESIIQSSSSNLFFKVYPVAVNDMIEADNGNVLFGTDIGIYEDHQTTIGQFPFYGQVWSVGVPGRVTNIDISGVIKSISVNPVNNNIILSISSLSKISKNQFQNNTLYIVDLQEVLGFKINQNSSRTVGGEITVELETEFTATWTEYVGKNVKFVGDQSIIDVNFDLLTQNNQLANGTICVSSNENNNLGKMYTVISNTSNQIIVSESIIPYNAITPDVTNESIIPGQSFVGLDRSGKVELNVTFTQNVVDNFLADFSFEVTDSEGFAPSVKGMIIYQNSRNKIILNNFSSLIDPEEITDPIGLIIQPNDIFIASGKIYQPLSSFNNKITSIESNHYHDLSLVGGLVSGSISSFSEVLISTVEFIVSNTTLFNNTIVQQDGSLFYGGRIRFYNPLQIGIEYFSEIIYHTSTTIKVNLLSNTNWNFSSYSQIKISPTWKWEIDATNYGYTENIYYSDFLTSSSIVTENITIGDSFINVSDTSDMVVGDKITIISSSDKSDKSEINFIKSIIDLTTIELDAVASKSYFISNTVQVKVLRDEFSNTHSHMVRNNQIQTISVEDYLDLGLSPQHSHISSALIDVISDMKKNENGILVVGSSSFVYNSNNDGGHWNKIVDINDFVEYNLDVQGIVNIDSISDIIVVGTSSGEIFSTGESSGILPLNKPKVN